MSKNVGIRFECGQEDRETEVFGPFEFVQVTYDMVRVGPEGDRELAYLSASHGMWLTEDGQLWSDFCVVSWGES